MKATPGYDAATVQRRGPIRGMDRLREQMRSHDDARRLRQRLVGRSVPSLRLITHTGQIELLGEFALGPALIYLYPGTVARGQPRLVSSNEDVAQHRAFSQCEGQLLRSFRRFVGLSCQTPAVQHAVAVRGRLAHDLISDPDLRLADELGLPTLTQEGTAAYCRLTLILWHGRVAAVFYPVQPAGSPEQAIAWMKINGHCAGMTPIVPTG